MLLKVPLFNLELNVYVQTLVLCIVFPQHTPLQLGWKDGNLWTSVPGHYGGFGSDGEKVDCAVVGLKNRRAELH